MREAQCVAETSWDLPPDSYIYALSSWSGKHAGAAAAISSDDKLRIFDTSTLQTISTREAHAGVTCLATTNLTHGPVFLTAGRDSLIKAWDARTERAGLELSTLGKRPFLSLSSSPTLPFVAAGTELEGAFAIVRAWDLRTAVRDLRTYYETHNDDITAVAFRPGSENELLSGSTDGLVNVYDLSVAFEDDAVISTYNHGSSVHRAGYLPLHASQQSKTPQIFALSHDEILTIYEGGETPDGPDSISQKNPAATTPQAAMKFGDIRPAVPCEYAIDVLSWNERALLATGSHSEHSLKINPMPRQGQPPEKWSSADTIHFPGAHGEEIVRSVIRHPSGRFFSGGEDGKVKVWTVGDVQKDDEMQYRSSGDAHGKDKARRHVTKQPKTGKQAVFSPY